MKTIVLLAGHATRMKPLSDYVNKGMIPVAGRPLAEYVLTRLVSQGFEDIILAVTRFPKQLESYFGDGSRLGAKIEYVHRPEPSGTAGEVHAMRELIPHGESFMVHYGDILTNFDVRAMREHHEATGATATIGLVTRVEFHAGVAELDEEGRLIGFVEKPAMPHLCHAAVDIFGPGIWPHLAPGLDFGYDVIPALIEAGEQARGFLDESAWWMDVGRLSDLEPAAEMLRRHGLV